MIWCIVLYIYKLRKCVIVCTVVTENAEFLCKSGQNTYYTSCSVLIM